MELGKSIELVLDMPPSVNALYIKRAGGQVALSKAANKYRELVKKTLAKKAVQVSLFQAGDPEEAYEITMQCYFEKLENPGWFEFYEKDSYYTKDSKAKNSDGTPKNRKGELKHHKGDRKAATRFKKIDVDNRMKFVQDCVVKGLGIPDDSQIFENRLSKRQGTERVVITIRSVPVEHYLEAVRA